MHRAADSDLHEPFTLRLGKFPFQMNLTVNLGNLPVFGFAVFTVFRVNAFFTQPNLNASQRDAFPVRIHAESDGSSGSQRGQQISVRPWAPVGAAERYRFIGNESVLSDYNFLGETLARSGTNNYSRRHFSVLSSMKPQL